MSFRRRVALAVSCLALLVLGLAASTVAFAVQAGHGWRAVVVIVVAVAVGIGVLGVMWSRAPRHALGELDKQQVLFAAADAHVSGLPRRLAAGEPVDLRSEIVPPDGVEIGRDEFGAVCRALLQTWRQAASAVLDSTRAATEAAQMSATAANLRYVNTLIHGLGRRTQPLVERLVTVLGGLERHEEDPDTLGRLFEADNLATQTRALTEDLIVVAGGKPGRTWKHPQPMADVLRGASGETTEYPRVKHVLLDQHDMHLAGHAVRDVVHLLADLIRNALQYSANKVTVTGRAVVNGYAIDVRDEGCGIPSDQLGYWNRLLSHPGQEAPEANLTQLGLRVIGRLARLHDVEVRLLSPNEYKGTTAVVLIPNRLIVDESPRPAPQPAQPPADAPADRPRPAIEAPTDSHAGIPATAPAALGPPAPHPRHAAAPARPTAATPEDQNPPLPRRIRQASLTAHLQAEPSPPPPDAPTTARSPEQIRDRLSQYQQRTAEGRAATPEPLPTGGTQP
ncbi:MAG: ATP-binding protein [Micromonosporaceae bacterium]